MNIQVFMVIFDVVKVLYYLKKKLKKNMVKFKKM